MLVIHVKPKMKVLFLLAPALLLLLVPLPLASAFQEPAVGQAFVYQGTASSQVSPLPGHANEYVAAVLKPRSDGAVYSGVLTYSTSNGANVEIWHAYSPGTPIPSGIPTANYNGLPIAVVDLSTSGASGSGSVPFSGNAVLLHSTSPFTATYTVNAVAQMSQTSGNNSTQPTSNTTSGNNSTQPASNTTSGNTLVCNSAVCDNSQFKEFGFDYDLNPLNIHIHKHSGVWHNERGVFVPWSLLCNQGQGQGYLIQSCGDLLDSTGSLTQAGDRAVGCITNGLIISVAANTVHLPLDLVKSALGALAPMTGCDGIVNLNTIQTGPQVQSLLTAISNATR